MRQVAIACRAADQTDPRRALENGFAFLLRHATQHANDFSFVLLVAKFAEAGKHFLRRFLADAAGVVEDHGRGFRRLDLRIAARKEHAGDFFRVVIVHLAAKRFEEEGAALVCRTGWHAERLSRDAPDGIGGRAPCQHLQPDVERFIHRFHGSLAQLLQPNWRPGASNLLDSWRVHAVE